jgi:hypothetical protein
MQPYPKNNRSLSGKKVETFLPRVVKSSGQEDGESGRMKFSARDEGTQV